MRTVGGEREREKGRYIKGVIEKNWEREREGEKEKSESERERRKARKKERMERKGKKISERERERERLGAKYIYILYNVCIIDFLRSFRKDGTQRG